MADPRTRQIKIQTGVVKRYEYSKIDQEFLMNFKYSIITTPAEPIRGRMTRNLSEYR